MAGDFSWFFFMRKWQTSLFHCISALSDDIFQHSSYALSIAIRNALNPLSPLSFFIKYGAQAADVMISCQMIATTVGSDP